MVKKKQKKPNASSEWQKKMTALPVAKRVAAKLSNEIRRMKNSLGDMKGWPDDEHDIGQVKQNLTYAIDWTQRALSLLLQIPDDFKPRTRRTVPALEEGDMVVILDRYLADYGIAESGRFEIQEKKGTRFLLAAEDGYAVLVPRGHIKKEKTDDTANQ